MTEIKEIDDTVREEIPERIPETWNGAGAKAERRSYDRVFCPGARYDLHICPERDLPVRREVLS